MRIDVRQFTRALVLLALTLATAIMFAVSVRGNYLFGYSLGQTAEKRELFAWASVAADVWKAFGLVAVGALWRHRHRRATLIACIAWLVCLLFGVNSSLGIYVHDRSQLTGARDATHSGYREAQAELQILDTQLQALPKHRSVGEVDAAINAKLARPIVINDRLRGTVATLSDHCAEIDTRTLDACTEIAQLRQEHAAAREGLRLAARAGQLRQRIIDLREQGGSIAPDPLGDFYSWITRGLVSARDVGFGFPLFFALLVEIVSAFGPVTIAAYAEAGRPRPTTSDAVAAEPATARHGAPRPATLSALASDTASVVSWLAERAMPTNDNRAVDLIELHRDYLDWCGARIARTVPIAEFGAGFDRVRVARTHRQNPQVRRSLLRHRVGEFGACRKICRADNRCNINLRTCHDHHRTVEIRNQRASNHFRAFRVQELGLSFGKSKSRNNPLFAIVRRKEWGSGRRKQLRGVEPYPRSGRGLVQCARLRRQDCGRCHQVA